MAGQVQDIADAPRVWRGAVEDLWSMYSGNPEDYIIGPPIGFGASSIVYSAQFKVPGTQKLWPVAVKVIDLERLAPSALRLLTRETQLMSLSKHPNVLRVRGSWVVNRKLHIALRLMRTGSVSDVMRYKFAAGVEEEVARCILKQALEGLNYLHINGLIHRDIKAANLLLDDDGTVLVGDLGVAASLDDEDAHKHAANKPVVRTTEHDMDNLPSLRTGGKSLGKRKSFVGTPCWMAPEVIAQKQYDASADIWSLGITALELCNGRAPYSRDPSSRVLQKILYNDPPTLDRKAGKHKYSQEFKEIIESCLVKDPTKRPTAAQLLETPFFRGAKKKDYLVSTLIAGLPPLVDRQERRKQPSLASMPSADSWDFSSTVHLTPSASPTSSMYSKSTSPTRAQIRGPTLPPLGVFDMDDEPGEEGIDKRLERLHIPSEHPRSSSYAPTSSVDMSSRTTSISAEIQPQKDEGHIEQAPVSQSLSSSSSESNPVDPLTPPTAHAAPGMTIRSSSSSKPSMRIWRKFTGRTKGAEEEKPTKEEKRRGSIVGLFLERTSSRTSRK
ncbi:Serine/threonine-protein kinase fray2 {ECO:0000250/UniProtKB:O61125, ECO:0000312/EMBL:EAL69242.1}; AltName: Full=STE20-like kinase fray2 {ECO:0000250/UniProtKB:O61125} [Serendipita indica DSM 11827]|nr:Serine/threonine-protein kinase fray2 {ECO:0000250/UniProtKB:O61125, ECO:0000312/EMBL:EAL69242.1}; AltName: Full=STE20-like kinase fray2 {ECO:0000250/UniProtKB:O61125} [Serendipita indica DSM 11827]